MMQHISHQSSQTVIRYRSPRWKLILRSVAKKHRLTVAEIVGPERDKDVCAARHEAAWRMRHKTNMSLPHIARRIGRADHTTAHHDIQRHQRRIDCGETLPRPTATLGQVSKRIGWINYFPKNRYSMEQWREWCVRRRLFIIAAHFELGWSERHIAKKIGVRRDSVARIIRQHKRATADRKEAA